MREDILNSLCSMGPAFLEAQRDKERALTALVGIPFDGTASFRAGARFGPDALRSASVALETYSPELNLDLEDCVFADLGNLEVGTGHPEFVAWQAGQCCLSLVEEGITPLFLGGDHSWTPGCVHALLDRYPELGVVQLDAHADLRTSYLGEPYSHASGMRRVLDRLSPESLLQVGIRSGTKEEWQEMREAHRVIPPCPSSLQEKLRFWEGRPLYLTVDLDLFDPAVFPGTGVPEPGGLDWPGFAALLNVLRQHHIVAADVVELSPSWDPSQASSILAAKVVRELLLILSEGRM